MSKRNKIIAGAVAAAVLLVAALGAAAVSAQGGTPTPTPWPKAGGDIWGFGRGGMMGGFGPVMSVPIIADVAKALGITTDALIADLRTGESLADIITAHGKTVADVAPVVLSERKADLDKSVADGKITQAQADAMLERMKTQVDAYLQNGVELGFGRGGMMRGGMPGFGRMGDQSLIADVAEALGITTDALTTDLRDGKSLSDIIAANGKTVVEVSGTILDQRKTDLDKAVADGTITQAQADTKLAQCKAQLESLLQNGVVPGVGRGRGCGGGGWFAKPNGGKQTPPTTTPGTRYPGGMMGGRWTTSAARSS